MARWVIIREGRGVDKVKVYYDNLITGDRHALGYCSSDVDDDMIVGWILNTGKPNFGDQIVLSDGISFTHRPAAAMMSN